MSSGQPEVSKIGPLNFGEWKRETLIKLLMAAVKPERLWEGGWGVSLSWAVLQTPKKKSPSGEIKTRWGTNKFLEHGRCLPFILNGTCWTEGREEGTEIRLNQRLWSCLVQVFWCLCPTWLSPNEQDSPGVDKNAWKALDGGFTLEIFSPFSAQDKLATNPSSFLTPRPWCAFQEKLSWKGGAKPSLKSYAKFRICP